jgi:polyhydroxybutyrate depolymerase
MYKSMVLCLFLLIGLTADAQTTKNSSETRCEGCGKKDHPQSGKATIDVDGLKREYILKLPADYDPNKQYKLIFVPHPLGGTMDMIANGGFNGLEKLSEGTAIFVAPQGVKGESAIGVTNFAGFENKDGRDVKFFEALLKHFKKTLCIDEKRVFSTGFSYGGMMSFAVGCAMWDEFRAIAPQSGLFISGCDTKRIGQGPIAVWQSHGNSGDLSLDGAKKARDYFIERNGCSTETTPVEPSPCVSYKGCKEGYPVIYCEYNGGHMPQSWAPAAIWKFFNQF